MEGIERKRVDRVLASVTVSTVEVTLRARVVVMAASAVLIRQSIAENLSLRSSGRYVNSLLYPSVLM